MSNIIPQYPSHKYTANCMNKILSILTILIFFNADLNTIFLSYMAVAYLRKKLKKDRNLCTELCTY